MKQSGKWLFLLFFSVYAINPAAGQYVMQKSIVAGSSINPGLHHATSKKLIHTSSTLQWGFVKDNIAAMESQHPYLDGVAASMNGDFSKDYLMLRGDKLWTEDDVQLNTVSQIKWGKYTENFVVLYFGDSHDFDFFNNTKWSTIIHNAGMVSKMLKAGRFKGVFIDDENYFEGSHGWKYDPAWYPGNTFAQVKAKCRDRGREFMVALQSNFTDPLVVLDFIWFGDHWNNYDLDTGRQILWMAFKDGMLEAAKDKDILVEGNELAYYYHETTMFTDIYNEFRLNKFPKYGAADLQEKYKYQVQIGHGLYPSLYYGLFRWSHKFTNEEQDYWWKSQLYDALLTTDKYVWIWSEKWNWFGDGTTLELTPNFASIVGEVKSKIDSQQSIGYDLVRPGDNWAGNLVKADDPNPGERWHISKSPEIKLIKPINHSTSKGDVTIEASVSDNTNKVEFYVNSMLVGSDSIAPYSVKVSGLKNGVYSIFGRAFDDKYEHHTSAPIVVTVNDK